MRRLLNFILLWLISIHVHGQLPPLNCQYLNNTMALNPAFAGSNDALSATVSYRNQWVGFPDAPVDMLISAHAPLNADKIGVGLMLQRSSVGIYNTTSFYGNYAYRIELRKGILALGTGLSASIYKVQWNRLIAADTGDELLSGNENSAFLPDFSIGAYYYTRQYFAGISIPEFLSHEFNDNSGKYRMENKFSNYTFMLIGGYYFKIGEHLDLLPSSLVKLNPAHGVQADINAQVILKDRLRFGTGYRTTNVLVGMLQCQVNYQLRFAYSYDFDLGKMGRYSSGSHEAAVSYVFSYVRKATGPRNF